MESPQRMELSFNDPRHLLPDDLPLVGKVITRKHLNQKEIILIRKSSWNLGPNVDIKVIDKNSITASFVRPEDRTRILNTVPWTVKGSLLPNRVLRRLSV